MGQTSFPPNGIIFAGAGILGATGAGSGASLTAAQVRAFASVYSTAEVDALIAASTPSWGSIGGTLTDQADLQAALSAKADSTAVTTALEGKADLVGGLVPASQLPSYVDDVIEAANFASLPATGETGKIYVTLSDGRTYRWSGSAYVELTDATAVWGSVSGTLANQTDLQSALNAKLPLSGGTLTGALSGTSASWSAGATITGGGISGTAGVKVGAYDNNFGGVWPSTVTPTSSNYALLVHLSQTVLNNPTQVILATVNTNRFKVDSNGHLLAVADNSYDIGASGANRPRNVYVGGSITAGGDLTLASTKKIALANGSFGVVLKSSDNVIGTDGLYIRNAADSAYGSLVCAGLAATYNATGQASGGTMNATASAYRCIHNKSDTGSFVMQASGMYSWASSDGLAFTATADTGIARNAAGVVEVNNGTAGTLRDFKARDLTLSGLTSLGPYTFATLPSASANSGKCLRITDRGQKIAYSDGTNWLFVHDNSVVT